MRKTTVYDVAERAGVSTATVSFTFRRPDKVKPATRERVLKAARELDYVPSANARGLARGKTGALGLYSSTCLSNGRRAAIWRISPPRTSSSVRMCWVPVVCRRSATWFRVECWHRGQTVLLGTAVSKRDNGSITDIAGRVDGLALFPNRGTDDLPVARLCRSIPVVAHRRDRWRVAVGRRDLRQRGRHRGTGRPPGDVHGVTEMSFIGELATYDMHQRFEMFQSRAAERGIAMGRPLLDDSTSSSREWLVTCAKPSTPNNCRAPWCVAMTRRRWR